VKAGNVTVDSITVLGTTPDFPQVRSVTVASGRYFTQTDLDRKTKVAVLGYALAKELFGDASSAIGQTVKAGTINLTVVGVMADQGTTNGTDYSSYLFTPITVVFEKFNFNPFAKMFGDRVRMIYVQVDPSYNRDDVIYQIKLLLVKRHDVTLDSLDFTITTQDDIIATQESATSAFRSLLGWVAGVSLLVGGIGIMNIMLVSVTERTREIGLRKAVGARKRDILSQFLTEAAFLSLVGGIIGIALGWGLSHLMGRVQFGASTITPVVGLDAVLLATLFSAAVGVFFGWYPAWRAAGLNPIDALRYE
jgi:putative ABC transport system permease protein